MNLTPGIEITTCALCSDSWIIDSIVAKNTIFENDMNVIDNPLNDNEKGKKFHWLLSHCYQEAGAGSQLQKHLKLIARVIETITCAVILKFSYSSRYKYNLWNDTNAINTPVNV